MTSIRVSALLLDLDGTLVDSEPLHRRGYELFFAAKGWDVPDLGIFTGRRALDVFATEPGPWSGLGPAGGARRGAGPRARRGPGAGPGRARADPRGPLDSVCRSRS